MKQSIAILVMLLLPLQVFAMDPITDDEMNRITGAVGVHIYVEGEVATPTYQVLQWQKHRTLNKASSKQRNPKKSDIYEISYDDCELRFDDGKTGQSVWINAENAVTSNHSLVKIGSSASAHEIATGNLHLSFKEISVKVSNVPDTIYIIPR
jgi:hypothetical protein